MRALFIYNSKSGKNQLQELIHYTANPDAQV
jgi:hypothetical protein